MSYDTQLGRMLGYGIIDEGTTISSQACSSTTHAVAGVFQWESSDDITDFLFRYNLRTGTPPTYEIGLQALDASGLPSGTFLASKTFTPPASTAWNATIQTITLDSPYTPTAGTLYAIVIAYNTGTVNTSNNSSFSYGTGNRGGTELPYAVIKTTGAWTKQSAFPILGFKTASRTCGFPLLAVYVTNTAATAGHRQGVRFNIPTGLASTVGIRGINAFMQMTNTAGATFTLKLIDTDESTVLASKQFDSDAIVARLGATILLFDSEVTVNAGSNYNLVLEVDSTTANWFVGMRALQFNSTADAGCMPLAGQIYHAAYNGTTWTYSQNMRPIAELVIGNVTIPSGGGSGGGMILRSSLIQGLGVL